MGGCGNLRKEEMDVDERNYVLTIAKDILSTTARRRRIEGQHGSFWQE